MKTVLFLIVALVVLTTSVSAQNNKASVLLSTAIYEEEVSGNLNKAAGIYLDIIKQYPSERQVAAKTLYHLGLVNEKMGKQKADAYFRRLVNTYPDQTEMVALAKAKLADYNNIASKATLKSEQSFRLASDLFKQAKYEAAVAEYEKTIQMTPKSQLAQEARLWIGQCYYKEGKYNKALESFKTIIKDYPESKIIPITEMLISQVQQSIVKEPKKSTTIALDEKTILDTVTGIRYTKINSWAGKNDIIKSASSITDISPNRKFLIADKIVVPFNNGTYRPLFDSLTTATNIRLSHDGSKIAYFDDKTISEIPVSPETGYPTGPVKVLSNGQYHDGLDLSWSSTGDSLIYSIPDKDQNMSLWLLNKIDGSTKQVTSLYPYVYNLDPVFTNYRSNILFKGVNIILMKSIADGKSLTLLDSCLSDKNSFMLSPDNRWIVYKKPLNKNSLFRLADNQKKEFSIPEEVGEFISWSDKGSKVFLYNPSSSDEAHLKIASVNGGPLFEFGKQYGQFSLGWTPDSKAIISNKREDYNDFLGKVSLSMINITDQVEKTIDGLKDYNNFCISPDFTKILVQKKVAGKMNDLIVLPFSLKDCSVSGDPILIINNFGGYLWDNSWSPDGKRIAITINGDIWIYNVETGDKIRLTNTPGTNKYFTWSPDGNTLAFNDYQPSLDKVWIISATDGKILNTYEKIEFYCWNPDGKEITISFLDGEINSFSLATGKSRKIVNWKELGQFKGLYDLKWSPDGKWIGMIVYKYDLQKGMHMYLINPVDGKAIDFDSDENTTKDGFYWSPDSKWIYYSTYGLKKTRLESTMWEADLTGFMNKIKSGTEKGYSTDFDFKKVAAERKDAPDGTFTDIRDGHVYKYKKIGTQTWMTENLAYLPEVTPDSVSSMTDKCYYVYGFKGSDVNAAKNSENHKTYGVLYNWNAAMNNSVSSNAVPSGVKGICPAGWHLPSDAEWMILEKSQGMSEDDLIKSGSRSSGNVFKKLKSIEGWAYDDDIFLGESGFNALPGGLTYPDNSSMNLNHAAFFWTSTAFNDTRAGNRVVTDLGFGLVRGPKMIKSAGNSVRCIKD